MTKSDSVLSIWFGDVNITFTAIQGSGYKTPRVKCPICSETVFRNLARRHYSLVHQQDDVNNNQDSIEEYDTEVAGNPHDNDESENLILDNVNENIDGCRVHESDGKESNGESNSQERSSDSQESESERDSQESESERDSQESNNESDGQESHSDGQESESQNDIQDSESDSAESDPHVESDDENSIESNEYSISRMSSKASSKMAMALIPCPVCSMLFQSSQLKMHKQEYHSEKCKVTFVKQDGSRTSEMLFRQNGFYMCSVCPNSFETYTQIRRHAAVAHSGKSNSELNLSCLKCFHHFSSAEELDQHMDTHLELQEVLVDDGKDDLGTKDSITLKQAMIELNDCTKNPTLSKCLLDMFVPHSLLYASGYQGLGLVTPSTAKRGASDLVTGARRIKMPRTSEDVKPHDLEEIISNCRLSGLVEYKQYSQLDSSVYHMKYQSSKKQIAQHLAGAIIQSKSQVILVLKAEVYGWAPKDDVHGVDLVLPSWDDKKVALLDHDNCRKLVVGTLTWSALITASIELLSGNVDVGVNNTTASVGQSTVIWGRLDWEKNILVERQLRSKFHEMSTYSECAAIFFHFGDWRCHPGTIFQLANYYKTKGWSGTKAAVTIFSEVLETKTIKKSMLESLASSPEVQNAETTIDIIRDLQRLVPANHDTLDLLENQTASLLLRRLADTLCSLIRTTNVQKVLPAIQSRIEQLLGE
ncbi:hypothetical protein BGZ76_000741 [Entomortierella beljakovae]|nr:hypothetical protein BGZ76_000741 [Entomortierella beljakovae]